MRSLLFFLMVALVGCSFERHWLSQAGVSQTVRVESGDWIYMDLDEDRNAGCQWSGICTDPDVDVQIIHAASQNGEDRVGTMSKAKVAIHVHRGYDGPSTVCFSYRHFGRKEPIKKFTISLFKRTGDCAFWE